MQSKSTFLEFLDGNSSWRHWWLTVKVREIRNCFAWDGISFAGFEQKSLVLFAAIKCRNDSKSKVSTFKFIEDPKLGKEWLVKMKRESFEPTKHSRFRADHFTADCFLKNLAVRTSVSSTFEPRRLNLKKDAVPTIFIFEKKENVAKNKSTPEEQNGNSRKPLRVRPAFA